MVYDDLFRGSIFYELMKIYLNGRFKEPDAELNAHWLKHGPMTTFEKVVYTLMVQKMEEKKKMERDMGFGDKERQKRVGLIKDLITVLDFLANLSIQQRLHMWSEQYSFKLGWSIINFKDESVEEENFRRKRRRRGQKK